MVYISVNKIIPNAIQDIQEMFSPAKKFSVYKIINIKEIIKKRKKKSQNKLLLFIEKILINQFLILNLNETDVFVLFITFLFYFFDKFNYSSFF